MFSELKKYFRFTWEMNQPSWNIMIELEPEKKAPKIKENFLEHFDNIELELKDVPITYLELWQDQFMQWSRF